MGDNAQSQRAGRIGRKKKIEMPKYYDTIQHDHDYKLSDGTILRHGNDPKSGRPWYHATKNGKIQPLRGPHEFLARLNADVAKSLLPAFHRARTPEEIVAVSQVIRSNRGRTSGPEVAEIYRTPGGRKYRVKYYSGQLVEWGYID